MMSHPLARAANQGVSRRAESPCMTNLQSIAVFFQSFPDLEGNINAASDQPSTLRPYRPRLAKTLDAANVVVERASGMGLVSPGQLCRHRTIMSLGTMDKQNAKAVHVRRPSF